MAKEHKMMWMTSAKTSIAAVILVLRTGCILLGLLLTYNLLLIDDGGAYAFCGVVFARGAGD